MSNNSFDNSSDRPANHPKESASALTRTRQLFASISPQLLSIAVWLAFILVVTGSATAQSDVGDVYCGTGVETGITIVFGAIAGLGLPATGFYVCRAGLSYMRAGGNPEKKNNAKERLVMSGLGFGIIVLALISPELIDNIGSQMGFDFSSCVRPF